MLEFWFELGRTYSYPAKGGGCELFCGNGRLDDALSRAAD